MAIFHLNSSDPDLILNENVGVDSGSDDVLASTFDLVDNALETYLLSLPGATTDFPQYAMEADYLQSSTTIGDYALVADGSGTAFSTNINGTGAATTLQTIDGKAISLFGYAGSNNVVLGRYDSDGNGSFDAVAFAIVLDEHMDSGHVASVDAWSIQYTALKNPDPTKIGAADPLDLSGLVYVQSTTTSVISVFTTSSTLERHAYDLPNMAGAQPEIVDSQLAPDSAGFQFWVQFTGDHATGGKTGVPLKVGAANPVAPTSGDTSFAAGDLFFADPTSIQATNATNGVAGDTLQNGEVLDMLFYNGVPSAPTSTIDQAPTQYANGIFLRFDGIGNTEDLVVVLKLADKNDPETILTTKATVIDAGDIYKSSTALSAFPDYLTTGANGQPSYLASHPLDNNDGLVVIESNDYNFGNDANGAANYVIVGLQLLSSTEKITGSGLDLDPTRGGSQTTEAFGKLTSDSDVIKISDIGFVRDGESSTTYDYLGIGANLIFQDDGPSIPTGSATPTLTVSERDDFGTAVSADFSGLFGTPDYGVDGAAATNPLVYDVGTLSTPTKSGLLDTATGRDIFLFLADNTFTPLAGDHMVVGRVADSSDLANPAGAADFYIWADQAGAVHFEEVGAVKHSGVNTPIGSDSVSFALTSNLVTLIATATDRDGDSFSTSASIAGMLTITDDAPTIIKSAGNLTPVSNDPNAATVQGDADGTTGNDGAPTYAWTISVAPIDSGAGLTAAWTDSTHQVVLGKLGTTDLYRLTVNNDGTYTFDLLSALPGQDDPVSSTQIHASGPAAQYDLLLQGTSGDYMRITGTNADGTPGLFNASNGYGGIGNGNLDTNETIAISLFDDNGTPATGDDFKRLITGIDIPTKTGNYMTHYTYTAYLNGTQVGAVMTQDVARNGAIHVDFGGALFDTVVIADTNANAVKLGVGASVIHTSPPDIQLDFQLQLTDGDGDYVATSFNVQIDGNGGGILNPTEYAYDLLV